MTTMYSPPYNEKEIRAHYPDKADFLLNDPVYSWRAKTGIELIHEEPTQEEQLRIWDNWQQMSIEQKRESDRKSLELFKLNNKQHYQSIMTKVWDDV